ncbi:MAG: Asp-tRNA(Asn)/Glu-tRNA(Gln) amidotransferase subunit GatB [Candidatus Omnitrophica bacterium]|nr:Asp-tRNA(Asn)/Glu-tRNA(Gln) amidotransferase subunit GatB [Candidatus Omnitrophota bacterium]
MSNKYETVIGLEVHVQLATKTKAFCGCSTKFGAVPNTQVCPVCLGLPGVLPVFNKKAFEYAIKLAIALDCDLQSIVKFDRKNYYYPDLPKNYQISQYDMPLAYNGKIVIDAEREGEFRAIGVTRAHLEEDAGKLIHDERLPFSYIDLNRTGTPLLEIVSEPDIRTPDEAYKYLTVLKQIIEYLEISDCNMEEGSLRCDANVSIRKKGAAELGSKVEIKNLNSFKAVRDALFFEEVRQEEILEDGGGISQETRLWDADKNVTISMRSKEAAHDYRYFPEPDLVPFEVKKGDIEAVRKNMPELPAKKRKRFLDEYKLNAKDVDVLISQRDIANLFESVAKNVQKPQIAANWVKGEVMKHLKEKNTDVKGLKLNPEDLSKIITMVENGTVSGLSAKEILADCIENGDKPDDIIEKKGLKQVSDEDELSRIVSEVIDNNVKSVTDFKNGKTNALSFLVGQVMKTSKGKANPKIAGEMLQKMLLS